jgi:hypothetical protein
MHPYAMLSLPAIVVCGLVSIQATIYADPVNADEIIEGIPRAMCILGEQQYSMKPLSVGYNQGVESEFETQLFPQLSADTGALFTISNGQELSIELNQSPKNIDAFLTHSDNGFTSVETLKRVGNNIFNISSDSQGAKTLEARVSFHNGLHVWYIIVMNIG